MMSLPVNVTGNELWQLIDGKLIATGRELKSVHVLISMSESGEESMVLQDETGVFVEVSVQSEVTAEASNADGAATEATPLVREDSGLREMRV